MKADIMQELRQLMGPLDPAAPHRVSDQFVEATAIPASEVFHRAVNDRSAGRTTGRRLVRRWALVGGAAILATGSVAAAKLLDSAPASSPGLVRCYSVASLTDDPRQFTDTAVASTDGQPAKDPSATVTDAVDTCAGLWRIGLIQNGQIVPDATANQGAYSVPQLTACVLSNGEAAVLPGNDQICRELGLSRLADRH